ncbi:putative conserved oligomeric Golgi complex subunit 8-like [Apostichopus japonicus]|uniref:Putative conserved oligomeric Golgi complex subunit 8-like n=1 Tax=Stichopus japonicus TaxID=307972 RepID=A0A2G8JFJ2_STIJA|nr:putative conserved oligomeric Golgi complex subunit 8-like [Apostichopus japonicus]
MTLFSKFIVSHLPLCKAIHVKGNSELKRAHLVLERGSSFQGFCETIANQLVPYMGRCLQALFPQSVIAQTMGLTVAELQKWGTVGILNISNIISEMDHLLPKKDSEIADTASETRNKRDDLSQIPEEDEEEEEKDSTKEADMEERVSGQRVNFEVGDEDGDNPERESVRELSKIDEEEEDRSAETEQEKGNGIDQGTVSSTAEGEPGGGDGGLLEGDEGEGEGKGRRGRTGMVTERLG